MSRKTRRERLPRDIHLRALVDMYGEDAVRLRMQEALEAYMPWLNYELNIVLVAWGKAEFLAVEVRVRAYLAGHPIVCWVIPGNVLSSLRDGHSVAAAVRVGSLLDVLTRTTNAYYRVAGGISLYCKPGGEWPRLIARLLLIAKDCAMLDRLPLDTSQIMRYPIGEPSAGDDALWEALRAVAKGEQPPSPPSAQASASGS